MVMAEFSIFPVGAGDSLSTYVARCTKIVEESGVKNQLHAMGTILEGPWDQVFGVIKRCYEELDKDCSRISLNIKVDIRRGDTHRMEDKVRSVREKI
jgi:uncharacterized protein (TIGR00106 family)